MSAYGSIFTKLAQRQVVVPYLESAIMAENWPDHYTVDVDSAPYYGSFPVDGDMSVFKESRTGSGDGRFHPSTHALLSERELYYRFHPDFQAHLVPDRWSYQAIMGMTVGTAMHSIFQTQLQMCGLLDESNTEVEFVDDEVGARGRMDCVLTEHPAEGVVPLEIKALDCDTPILAERGWTTMGDLTDSDRVHALDGSLVSLRAHPIRRNRPCYEMTFRDGQSMVSDEEHLWTLYDTKRNEWRTLTTKEIADSGVWRYPSGGKYRFRNSLPEPLGRPDADLPLDPWLLGYWLGNGSASGATVHCHSVDVPWLTERLGRMGLEHTASQSSTNGHRIGIRGIRATLREMGVLDGKSIPSEYLTASAEQRRALLAGLMDSDGTVGGHQVALGMKDEGLVRGALSLARSLGHRATLTTGAARLNGRDMGEVYWMKFSTARGGNPFDLPRKREAFDARPKGEYEAHSAAVTNALVDIRQVPSRPTRCITVDHPSRLFLAGEGYLPTHNTITHRMFDRQMTGIKPSWDAQFSICLDQLGHDSGVVLMVEIGQPFRMHEFRVHRNADLVEQVYEKWGRVRQALEADIPPDRCCGVTSCAAREICGVK